MPLKVALDDRLVKAITAQINSRFLFCFVFQKKKNPAASEKKIQTDKPQNHTKWLFHLYIFSEFAPASAEMCMSVTL